ncbi:MAG: TIGR01777 family protein [Bacteroidales bacterium]|nr:TIGR01777 family protein [Bacteroidales bacterium]
MKKKIVLIGSTGFIGSSLVEMLSPDNELVIFTRNKNVVNDTLRDKNVRFVSFTDPDEILIPAMENCKVIINLAGAGIGDQRWTTARKKEILDSRVQTILQLSNLLLRIKLNVETIIQASAIGYYGFSEYKAFTENDESGEGFLAEIARKWEKSANDLNPFTKRLIIMRLGVVLSDSGGAFPKMIAPFKFYIGGKLGTEKQWLSWIHLEDVQHAVKYFIDNQQCEGVYNLVSPKAVTNTDFAKMVGKCLHKPAIFLTPSFLIKIAFGKMGEELLLKGAHVLPKRLTDAGFKFRFHKMEEALEQLFDN